MNTIPTKAPTADEMRRERLANYIATRDRVPLKRAVEILRQLSIPDLTQLELAASPAGQAGHSYDYDPLGR